jgi:sugar/nucleoside kinase (ribokinase family)
VGRPNYLVIGHVAKDLIGDGYRLGGTAAYSALTARNLGRRAAIITCAGSDVDLTGAFNDIDLLCLPSPVTTTFRNVYTAGDRQQYIKAVAEAITEDRIPARWRDTSIVHLGPIVNEFDGDMIKLFPSSLVGLTPQGWLRRWDTQGRVSPRSWTRASEFLQRIDALIVSQEDLSGEAGALRTQLELASIAVVTEGAGGATLHYRGKTSHSPPRETQMVDPTGAGDVFAAAFLVRLSETGDPQTAATFANVAASLSVEEAGLASAPQRAQIEQVLSSTP